MKTGEITIYEQKDGTHAFLPFWLPERRVGNFQIRQKTYAKGSKLTAVSMRNALFMGLNPANIELEHDTIAHFLYEKDGDEDPDGINGLWMSTRPQEIEQHNRQLAKAEGDVLVGGLGLGLAVGILHNNPRVDKIIVIEKSPDVIKLVKPYLPQGKTTVIRADLFTYLQKVKRDGGLFDFAFYDIHTPTSQFLITTTTKPLRRRGAGPSS